MTAIYGYCPICGAKGWTRQRRIDGDDTCMNGHHYKSTEAIPAVREKLTKYNPERKINFMNLVPDPFAIAKVTITLDVAADKASKIDPTVFELAFKESLRGRPMIYTNLRVSVDKNSPQ